MRLGGISDKVFEQAKLAKRGIDRFTLNRQGHGIRIEFDVAKVKQRGVSEFIASSQGCPDSGDQLALRKRFCDVIVCPGFQSGYLVSLVSAMGDENDRYQTQGRRSSNPLTQQ